MGRGRYRTRIEVVALVVVVLAGTVAVVGWRTTASRAAARVSSSWTLDCPGTRVDAGRTTTVRDRPGWRCSMTLRIRNGSARAVRVDRVEAPYTGPGSGIMQGHSTADAVFRAVPETPGDPPRLVREFAIDGEFVVDRTVAAHDSMTVVLSVGEPRTVCTSAGTTTGTITWPVVVVDAWHRTFHRPTRQSLDVMHPHDRATEGCPR